MKGNWKILLGLGAAVAILVLATPASHAQCTVSKEFGALGGGKVAGRVTIDTSSVTASRPNPFPTTNPITGDTTLKGSFWQIDDPTNNNDGPHFAGADTTCPCTSGNSPWCWNVGSDLGLRGYVASPDCLIPRCPEPMTLVWAVEDTSGDDAATSADAGFIAYAVNESLTTVRYWDHSRTANPSPGALTVQVMERFPTVDVVTSAGPPPNTTLTNTHYVDVAVNVHACSGGTPATQDPASTAVQSYDVCVFRGTADPGRVRAAWDCDVLGWSLPYSDSDITDLNRAVPGCTAPDDPLDTFLAVGVTYVGGVKSYYVGSSTAIECDPTLADPDEIKRPRPDSFDSRRRPMGRRGR